MRGRGERREEGEEMSNRSIYIKVSSLGWMTIATWMMMSSAVYAQRTNQVLTPVPTVPTAPVPTPPVSPAPGASSTLNPTTKANPASVPTSPIVIPPPPPPATNIVIPPPPPPPLSGKATAEDLNNPLEAPQNIDKILSTRMNADQWALMYQPLSCLDSSIDCVQKLQNEAVANSPIIKGVDAKIQEINNKITEARTNNRKSIDLAIFEPGLQVFLTQKTVVENGQTRTIGFLDRVGQIFSNPGGLLNDLLAAVGIPILRSAFGGTDAQQSRMIQLSDLAVKVAEMERGKAEIAAKTRERIQQLVLEFDAAAREFQAEQSIVVSQKRSFKIYSITYAAGDGDTNTYLSRKEQLEKSKLQVFRSWARLRAHISNIKTLVITREV